MLQRPASPACMPLMQWPGPVQSNAPTCSGCTTWRRRSRSSAPSTPAVRTMQASGYAKCAHFTCKSVLCDFPAHQTRTNTAHCSAQRLPCFGRSPPEDLSGFCGSCDAWCIEFLSHVLFCYVWFRKIAKTAFSGLRGACSMQNLRHHTSVILMCCLLIAGIDLLRVKISVE